MCPVQLCIGLNVYKKDMGSDNPKWVLSHTAGINMPLDIGLILVIRYLLFNTCYLTLSI